MNGRLGNQMFRYAFARWLQLQVGEIDKALCLDFSNILQEQKKGEMAGWEDSLAHFYVRPYTYYNREGRLLLNETNRREKIVLFTEGAVEKLLGKWGPKQRLAWKKLFLPWENRHGIYRLFVGYDYPYRWEGPRRKIVSGPFECARYPEEIRETLLREFTPRREELPENRELYARIRSTNAVCMTVRRGNFLQYKTLDVCGAGYFERAAREMALRVADPVFFVFSDDVAWAREHIRIDAPVYYESGKDPVWEKLRMMYSCRHFIISNSTFSWWAQFLGQAEDKVVIAPDHWFNGPYQPPLYEKHWICVKARK